MHEHCRARNEWQDKQRDRLSEHVTQGDQAQKANRKEGQEPSTVGGDDLQRRNDVGQNILMRNEDTLGLSGGARREHNLHDIVSINGYTRGFTFPVCPFEAIQTPSAELGIACDRFNLFPN